MMVLSKTTTVMLMMPMMIEFANDDLSQSWFFLFLTPGRNLTIWQFLLPNECEWPFYLDLIAPFSERAIQWERYDWLLSLVALLDSHICVCPLFPWHKKVVAKVLNCPLLGIQAFNLHSEVPCQEVLIATKCNTLSQHFQTCFFTQNNFQKIVGS